MGIGGVGLLPLIMLLIIVPLFFLPTIIAFKKNHRHKVPIILVNILGGLFYGVGWIAALAWCYLIPESDDGYLRGTAGELEKLYDLKERGVLSEEEFSLKKKDLL